MRRRISMIIAALALPIAAHSQSEFISISVWNVPADPSALIQNPDLAANFEQVVELGADRIYAGRISESSVANITFYPASDELDAILERTNAVRDGAASIPGFDLLQVLQGSALTRIDATPITSGLSYVLSSSGNAVSSSSGECLQLENDSSMDCPGAAQDEHVSISVWNVPADPAVLAQDPTLAGQLQSFVDLGADRMYPVRLSESSVAFVTFYPVNDALEAVLASTSEARAATDTSPGFDLLEVLEARVIYLAD